MTDILRDAIEWCLNRDERNGSLPEAYANKLRDALSAKEVDVAQLVWDGVGTALALLSYADASTKARAILRDALESATGRKAPKYLGGNSTPLDWLDMSCAPKDGTMLLLLVVPSQEEFTAFDDSLNPYETIGFNNLADTQEDRWEFSGWDWSQDCFITGRGEVIGWRPF